ncbi:hypothetical protein [Marinospirillum alkaliphilum]|uniref:hypothetical protein n=1 Tax=Marinospirillum alkaliphilum TaxID=148454 RepID=UPI001160724E|nr:hypothetical protein [Marinospirillum alkaliphilum]
MYHHKSKGYQAVPVGFSIAAFVTSFIWAAANSLWGKAFLLFVGFMMMLAAAAAGALLDFPLLALCALAGIVLLPLWAGAQGQQWICDKLESQGYRLVKRINAESASNAINAAKRSEKQQETVSNNKATPQNKPAATFGRDFRDIRDNASPNSNQPPPQDFNARPWKKGR